MQEKRLLNIFYFFLNYHFSYRPSRHTCPIQPHNEILAALSKRRKGWYGAPLSLKALFSIVARLLLILCVREKFCDNYLMSPLKPRNLI